MLPSTSRLLPAFVLLMGISACTARPVISPTAISTQTPAAATQSATRQPPTLTPTSTLVVPTVPDDERILASIDVGQAPWNMTAGLGLLWVIAGDTIVRIDPQTSQVMGTPIHIDLPAGAGLEGIAVGEDSLWVSRVGGGRNSVDSLLRMDPRTGDILETIKVRRGPMTLAYTPGKVWAVNMEVNTVSAFEIRTNELAGEPLRTGRAPYGMTAGDGSVWVVNHGSNTLTRIDPGTNSVIADIPLPWEPHRVGFGEEAVWVGNWHDLSVSRVDPQTNQVVGEPIYIGYATGNITGGLGSVWVTSDYRGVQAFPEPFADHTVLIRIDPKTNQVVDTIPLGGHPVDVEVTEEAVWVSIQNPDYILKIRP